MLHSFDPVIAKSYGVNVAIFLQNLYFWIKHNAANNKHSYNNNYWTYNSLEAYAKLFPYFSKNIIRGVIEKCINSNLISVDNFNKMKFDRTRWYSFTQKGLGLFPDLEQLFNNKVSIKSNDCIDQYIDNIPLEPATALICEFSQMEDVKFTNRFVENHRPIPDINTDNKPDNKHTNLFPEEFPVEIKIDESEKSDSLSRSRKKKDLINNIEPYISVYNEISVPYGCREIKKGKEDRKLIKRSLSSLFDELYDDGVELTPGYLSRFLKSSGEDNWFVMVKCNQPLHVLLRPKNFLGQRERLNTLQKNNSKNVEFVSDANKAIEERIKFQEQHSIDAARRAFSGEPMPLHRSEQKTGVSSNFAVHISEMFKGLGISNGI